MANGGGQSGNVYQQAATGLGQAGQATQAAMQYQPQQLANTNLQPYMNPYTQNVVDQSLGDIDRMRQMSMNDLGAQATRAGAFGGSRLGVAEAGTNEAAMRQAGQLGAQLRNQGFQNAQGAAQFDIGNQMAGQQFNLGAAGQMAGLAGQGFGMGQQVNQQQMQQGILQQGLSQQLIDAAKNQFSGYTNAPANSLQYPLAAIGGVPQPQTQTTSKQLGLFDYLSAGAGLASMFSDARLKDDITPIGSIGGVNVYRWKWTPEGKSMAGDQPEVGVIADEVMATHPQHVTRGADGFLRVDYAGLASELEAA